MDAEQATIKALQGEGILFVGSGFSLGARNEDGDRIPSGQELSEILSALLRLPSAPSLPTAAQMFTDSPGLGAPRLKQILKSSFRVGTASADHRTILSVPWRRIYTTNYDNLVEFVFKEKRANITSVTSRAQPSALDFSKLTSIHLHGSVEQIDQDNEGYEDFVLTHSDYMMDKLKRTPWPSALLSDIETNAAIFFVGYSLSDLDIARIIYEKSAWRKKIFFFVAPDASLDEEFRLKFHGTVIKEGAAGFASLIASTKAHRELGVPQPRIFSSFVPIVSPDTTNTRVTDDTRFDLLIKGEFDPVAMKTSNVIVGQRYIVKREDVSEVAYALSRTKNVVLHSGIGNGKTIFCEIIAQKLLGDGIKYFRLDRHRQGVEKDLREIFSLQERHVIEIENYGRNLELMRFIQSERNDRTSCLLTSRSALHELIFGQLKQAAGTDEFAVFDLNRLTRAELGETYDLLSETGILGPLATKARTKDGFVKYVSQELGSEFSNVLVDVLNSPAMKSKLTLAWRDLTRDADIARACIGACVLEALSYGGDLGLLTEIGFLEPETYSKLRRLPDARNFFVITDGDFRVRSPVLAEFLVVNIDDVDLVTDVLVDLADTTSRLAATAQTSNQLFRDLTLFANVARFFSGERKDADLINYFERIKPFPTDWEKPFYWLQYSISRLAAHDFEKASLYLDNAKRTAANLEKKGFRDFHIKNHEARLLLEEILFVGDQASSFSAFREAHTIVRRQISERETRAYPYAVARLYADVFTRFFEGWPKGEQEFLVAAVREVLKGIDKLSTDVRASRRVRQCEARLRPIADAADL